MTSAAHQPVVPRPVASPPVARWRDPDVVVVTLRLTLRELTLLYAVAYLAHAIGTPLTGTVAAYEGDAATVLHRASCKMYVELRAATVRGGL